MSQGWSIMSQEERYFETIFLYFVGVLKSKINVSEKKV